jgi:hypothetical protein
VKFSSISPGDLNCNYSRNTQRATHLPIIVIIMKRMLPESSETNKKRSRLTEKNRFDSTQSCENSERNQVEVKTDSAIDVRNYDAKTSGKQLYLLKCSHDSDYTCLILSGINVLQDENKRLKVAQLQEFNPGVNNAAETVVS